MEKSLLFKCVYKILDNGGKMKLSDLQQALPQDSKTQELISVLKYYEHTWFSFSGLTVTEDKGIQVLTITENTDIQVLTNLKICSTYNCTRMSHSGCQSENTCNDLHVCSWCVIGTCQKTQPTCKLQEHNFLGEHNDRCLKIHSKNGVDLCSLPPQCLNNLLLNNRSKVTVPQICSNDRCSKLRCGKLHICWKFLNNYENHKKDENCTFPHVFKQSDMEILSKYGLQNLEEKEIKSVISFVYSKEDIARASVALVEELTKCKSLESYPSTEDLLAKLKDDFSSIDIKHFLR